MKAYVMIGAPGSGKSTLAAELAESENAVVISGDEIRKELYGSSEIRGKWKEVYDMIDDMVYEACAVKPVILDGTHYDAWSRREAISLLRSYGYTEIAAVVVNPSLATCITRNFMRRERNVPDYVVKEMYERVQASLPNLTEEGFDSIHEA